MHNDNEQLQPILCDPAAIAALIATDGWMMRALRTVAMLSLPDWWIPAGFVRAKVWDTLHGHAMPTRPNDIDVVFFDPNRAAEADIEIEAKLSSIDPTYPWEVVNQAHIHTYNGDPPYRNSIDAISRWAETVSTVAVRLDQRGEPEVAAPYGIEDLVGMVIRPTPHADAKPEVFEMRLRRKSWHRRWPLSTIRRD